MPACHGKEPDLICTNRKAKIWKTCLLNLTFKANRQVKCSSVLKQRLTDLDAPQPNVDGKKPHKEELKSLKYKTLQLTVTWLHNHIHDDTVLDRSKECRKSQVGQRQAQVKGDGNEDE